MKPFTSPYSDLTAIGPIIEIIRLLPEFKNTEMDLIERYHLSDVDSEGCFIVQNLLDFYRFLFENYPLLTRKIGRKIPKYFPRVQDDDFEKTLETLNIGYHFTHRKNNLPLWNPERKKLSSGIGNYLIEKINKETFFMKCTDIYPCELDIGIAEGIGELFGVQMEEIKHKDEFCRMNGDDYCLYELIIKHR